MQSTNSEYGSPYLVVGQVTFTVTFKAEHDLSWPIYCQFSESMWKFYVRNCCLGKYWLLTLVPLVMLTREVVSLTILLSHIFAMNQFNILNDSFTNSDWPKDDLLEGKICLIKKIWIIPLRFSSTQRCSQVFNLESESSLKSLSLESSLEFLVTTNGSLKNPIQNPNVLKSSYLWSCFIGYRKNIWFMICFVKKRRY